MSGRRACPRSYKVSILHYENIAVDGDRREKLYSISIIQPPRMMRAHRFPEAPLNSAITNNHWFSSKVRKVCRRHVRKN